MSRDALLVGACDIGEAGATRLAIGSSRGRIIRQLIAESVPLSAVGGAAGILPAVSTVKALIAFPPATLTGYGIAASPDPRMLAFSFALAVSTGLLFAGFDPVRVLRYE